MTDLLNETQMARLFEKVHSFTVDPSTFVITWSGKVLRPPMTGKEMCEFAREKLLCIGQDIGDPESFWNASPTGELMHVYEAFNLACMVDEVLNEAQR